MALSTNQKYGVAFGIIAAIVVLLIIFWDKLFGPKIVELCPNGKPVPEDGNCQKVMTQQEVQNYNTTSTPPSTTNTSLTCDQPISYQAESFPLAWGMIGDNVAILQKYLKIGVDKKFGCFTRTAAIKQLGMPTVDEATFDQIKAILKL